MSPAIDPKTMIGFSDLIKQFYFYRKEELQALHMKISHCRLLHLLSDHNGISQQQIADMTAVSRSTISETFTEMMKEGYIERQVSKEDKRLSLIYLTEKGLKKAEAIRTLFNDFCSWCMRDYTEAEIRQLEHLLKKFRFQ